MTECNRESWLKGNARNGETVLIGGGVHCAGCGGFQGVIGWIADEEYLSKEPTTPDWPFEPHSCPVCGHTSHKPGFVDVRSRRTLLTIALCIGRNRTISDVELAKAIVNALSAAD